MPLICWSGLLLWFSDNTALPLRTPNLDLLRRGEQGSPAAPAVMALLLAQKVKGLPQSHNRDSLYRTLVRSSYWYLQPFGKDKCEGLQQVVVMMPIPRLVPCRPAGTRRPQESVETSFLKLPLGFQQETALCSPTAKEKAFELFQKEKMRKANKLQVLPLA